jgi:hypothetical protein
MKLPAFPSKADASAARCATEIAGPPLSVYLCRCKDRQRFSGGARTMSMPIRRERVVLLRGELAAFEKTADSERVVRMLGRARAARKSGTSRCPSPLSRR